LPSSSRTLMASSLLSPDLSAYGMISTSAVMASSLASSSPKALTRARLLRHGRCCGSRRSTSCTPPNGWLPAFASQIEPGRTVRGTARPARFYPLLLEWITANGRNDCWFRTILIRPQCPRSQSMPTWRAKNSASQPSMSMMKAMRRAPRPSLPAGIGRVLCLPGHAAARSDP
jgi:hypothetical protein